MGGLHARFRVLRMFTVSKTTGVPNEDRACVSEDGSIWSVSDGASVSYDSGPWAEVLVQKFVQEPNVSGEWLNSAISDYGRSYDRESMEWMQQAAFDRGSFATLLGGIATGDGKHARVIAVGDSMLAVVDGAEVVRTLPYVQPDQFDSAPVLLSTNRVENRQFDEKTIADSWSALDLSSLKDPMLLVMTDALGKWLLDQPNEERVMTLLNIASEDSFVEFVELERSRGRLRRDDCTLLVVGRSDAVSANH